MVGWSSEGACNGLTSFVLGAEVINWKAIIHGVDVTLSGNCHVLLATAEQNHSRCHEPLSGFEFLVRVVGPGCPVMRSWRPGCRDHISSAWRYPSMKLTYVFSTGEICDIGLVWLSHCVSTRTAEGEMVLGSTSRSQKVYVTSKLECYFQDHQSLDDNAVGDPPGASACPTLGNANPQAGRGNCSRGGISWGPVPILMTRSQLNPCNNNTAWTVEIAVAM